MKAKILFPGDVKAGGFYFDKGEKANMQKYISTFPDGRAAMSFDRLFNKRTIKQNSLYWLRGHYLGLVLGMTKDDMHEICMERAGYGRNYTVAEKLHWVRSSSTKLDTKKFSALMDEQDQIVSFYNDSVEKQKRLLLPKSDHEQYIGR